MKKETKQERAFRKKEQTKINTLKKNAIKKYKREAKDKIELEKKLKRDAEYKEMLKHNPSGMAIAEFPKF